MLWTIDPAGENLSAMSNLMSPQGRAKLSEYFPDWDIHRSKSSIYRMAATNIYKTLDGKFFHLHGRAHYTTDKLRGSPSDSSHFDL